MAIDAAHWRKKHPAQHKVIYTRANHRSNLKNRFGLTVEEFNILVAQSDGLCGICREIEIRDRRMCLDHDHKTGVVRGFLCSRCNLLLGNAADSIELLENACRYLISTKALRTSDEDAPVPMLLFCPQCCGQHVDEGLFEHKRHATHACQHCGLVWRPALVPTVGVQFLPGFKSA